MKRGEIIPFDEAAARIRERRHSVLGLRDWFWCAALVCWPISAGIFLAQSFFEAVFDPGERSP